MNHSGPVDLASITLTGCSLIQSALLDIIVKPTFWHHVLAFFAVTSLISASIYNAARFIEWLVLSYRKYFKSKNNEKDSKDLKGNVSDCDPGNDHS